MTQVKKRTLLHSPHTDAYAVGYAEGRADGFQQGRQAGIESGHRDRQQLADSALLHPVIPKQRITRVLVITPSHIPSLEIGLLQPFGELAKSEDFAYEVRTKEAATKEIIAEFDAIVFIRNVDEMSWQAFEWARELGKHTVYYIDDNFLSVPLTTSVGLYYGEPHRMKFFIQFLKQADVVKVDSSYFRDYIAKHFNPNVVYFAASVDFDWLKSSRGKERKSKQIVIGYEGTIKEDDFAVVVPALRRVLEEYGDEVKFESYGYFPSALSHLRNVKHLEGDADYRQFLRTLNRAQWDIGIAPLAPTHFNSCKTNNKFREYSACRIPGIYSDMPAYNRWVVHGETGYLATHSEEGWYQALTHMIQSPDLRNTIREKAYDFAEQYFNVPLCAQEWKNKIFAQ